MLNVNRAARTIDGRAAPYGVTARPRLSLPRRFARGSLTWDESDWPPLLLEHDNSLRVGRAFAFQQLSWGLWASFKVRNGPVGDRVLEMAAATHCGLSIDLAPDAEWRLAPDGAEECVFGRIVEVSLTRNPVFV